MVLFSIVYWVFFILSLPVMFIPALLIWAFTAPFDRRRVLLHMYSSFWGMCYIYTNPMWKVKVNHRSRIPWRRSVIIVSNHASLIDIVVMYGLYRPYKWVSKIENFKLPIIGWLMKLNAYVPLVRGDRKSIMRMMETCRDYLNNGSSVLIFPEGTRSKTGELQAFKNGAFELAMETGRPVVPVAVNGTARSLPKHGLILRDRMDCVAEVLEPLNPSDFSSVDELRDATHAAIGAALSPVPERALDQAV